LSGAAAQRGCRTTRARIVWCLDKKVGDVGQEKGHVPQRKVFVVQGRKKTSPQSVPQPSLDSAVCFLRAGLPRPCPRSLPSGCACCASSCAPWPITGQVFVGARECPTEFCARDHGQDCASAATFCVTIWRRYLPSPACADVIWASSPTLGLLRHRCYAAEN